MSLYLTIINIALTANGIILLLCCAIIKDFIDFYKYQETVEAFKQKNKNLEIELNFYKNKAKELELTKTTKKTK